MRDAVILANNLKDIGINHSAIVAYEKKMQPHARDVIERSNISGDLFFDFNSPATFGEYMRTNPGLIKDVGVE